MVSQTVVAEAVHDVRDRWEISGESLGRAINTGECDPFAHAVCHAVPDDVHVEIQTTENIPSTFVLGGTDEYHPEPWHVWVTDGDRHYDSETPNGVAAWRDLPFFQRTLGV